MRELENEPCVKVVNDDIYSAKLPNPVLLNFYNDMENRVLWVDFDITDGLIEFEKYIIKWNKEDKDIDVKDRKPIKMLIYSYGGDVDVMFSFIDIMELSKTPVYTYNMGCALSAAALMFMAGHKRYMMPKAQTLIHQGNISGVSGTTNQVIETIDNMKKIEKEIKAYILQKSKIDEKTYKKNEKKEWYLTAEECINFGVADEIIDDIDTLY